MGLIRCARFEAPLSLLKESLHLEVFRHGQKLVLINILFGGIKQAVFYTPPELELACCNEAERACRLALGQFAAHLFRPRTSGRRPALLLDLNARPYESVLLQSI
jgi:hypothetical protein